VAVTALVAVIIGVSIGATATEVITANAVTGTFTEGIALARARAFEATPRATIGITLAVVGARRAGPVSTAAGVRQA
jgi:hypothetical protein